MKYMLTWTERPQGSPIEYENAQKRILEVFTQWKAPGIFKIESQLVPLHSDYDSLAWASRTEASWG